MKVGEQREDKERETNERDKPVGLGGQGPASDSPTSLGHPEQGT